MDVERQLEFLLYEQAKLESELRFLKEASDTHMESLVEMADFTDQVLLRERAMQKWRAQANRQIAFLLRAQEQTDSKLDAVVRAQAENRELLLEIMARLAVPPDKSED